MKILKDSRQMPKKKEYMANKMYSDIVYAWIQVNSQWDKQSNTRWINKKDVKFTVIADELGITRQTVSTRFKRLLDKDEKGNAGLGLIIYNDELQRYELSVLSPDVAMLIEKGTLRTMISALNENTINVFIYLLNRYLANQEQSFDFTIEQIKVILGLSIKTRSNDYIITDILRILKRIGLLNYKLNVKKEKTIYKIIYMTNEIKDKEDRC